MRKGWPRPWPWSLRISSLIIFVGRMNHGWGVSSNDDVSVSGSRSLWSSNLERTAPVRWELDNYSGARPIMTILWDGLHRSGVQTVGR